MSLKVIGICARARHGKDTAAEAFLTRGDCYRVAFADPLKLEMAEKFHRFKEFQVEFDEVGRISYPGVDENTDPYVLELRRAVWQIWGTEGRRHVFDDYWLWQFAPRALQIAALGFKGVVVPDVRFENEARFIRDQCGGVVIGVNRGAYDDGKIDSSHASERDIPEIMDRYAQVVVNNLDSLDAYQAKMAEVANDLMGGVNAPS